METDLKPSGLQPTELPNCAELSHPASTLTLVAMQVWERCIVYDQIPRYQKVSAPPLPPLPQFSVEERISKVMAYEMRALEWELTAKASRYPQELESIDYQYRAVPGWKAFRLPGTPTPKGTCDSLLVVCPTSLILDFWEACRGSLQLAPFRLIEATGCLEPLSGPILTLSDFQGMILATIPIESLPHLPIPQIPGTTPFQREAVQRINDAYRLTGAALGQGGIWAPILP